MNITAETVTVVVQAAPDWTGPAVGILGVVLGSLMGLSGIRWQHDAQRAYDVRKQCAELISIGENRRNGYLFNTNGMPDSEIQQFLSNVADKHDEMDRFLRHVELIASARIEKLAKEYSLATDQYQVFAILQYKFDSKPVRKDLDSASKAWETARSELIAALKPRHSRPQGRFAALRARARSWFDSLRRRWPRQEPGTADR